MEMENKERLEREEREERVDREEGREDSYLLARAANGAKYSHGGGGPTGGAPAGGSITALPCTAL